ncbi:MAG: hypothetical protein ACOH12_14145 [Parvibaculaceae bacterium]
MLMPLCLVALCGCALIDSSRSNLHYASTKIVDLKDEPPATWFLQKRPPSTLALLVNFTTDESLTKLAHRHEFNIVNEASLCDSAGEIDLSKELQNDSSVYDSFGLATTYDKSDTQNSRLSNVSYHVYINLKGIPLAGDPDVFLYDLKSAPQNVCVRLSGGNMLGSKITSNTFVVPKMAIVNALKDADLTLSQ